MKLTWPASASCAGRAEMTRPPGNLDHLVPALPSTAAEAGKLAFSVEDAVAVCPWESRVAAWALPAAPGEQSAQSQHSKQRTNDVPAVMAPLLDWRDLLHFGPFNATT